MPTPQLYSLQRRQILKTQQLTIRDQNKALDERKANGNRLNRGQQGFCFRGIARKDLEVDPQTLSGLLDSEHELASNDPPFPAYAELMMISLLL